MMREYSWWWITAQHKETREEKTRVVKFHGPFPLKDELEFYCPPDVCTILKMKESSWTKDEQWIDESIPSQEKLQERMFESIEEKKKNYYAKL